MNLAAAAWKDTQWVWPGTLLRKYASRARISGVAQQCPAAGVESGPQHSRVNILLRRRGWTRTGTPLIAGSQLRLTPSEEAVLAAGVESGPQHPHVIKSGKPDFPVISGSSGRGGGSQVRTGAPAPAPTSFMEPDRLVCQAPCAGREFLSRPSRLPLILLLLLLFGCRDVLSETMLSRVQGAWTQDCQTLLYYQRVGTIQSPVFFYGRREFTGYIEVWEIHYDNGETVIQTRKLYDWSSSCK